MNSMFSSDAIALKLKQTSVYLIAFTLALSAVVPALLVGSASAVQITERSITMETSERAATDVVYTLSFKPGSTHTARGLVVQFCANSPLIGAACTAPANGNTLEGFDTNEGSLTVTGGSWTIDAATDANTVILTDAVGDSYTAGAAETITFGTNSSDGFVNPTYDSLSPGTFYARVLTYGATADAVGYTDTDPSAVGAPVDTGGIALSTSNQLTVDAVVQEELEFCVGATAGSVDTDAEAPADCTDDVFDTVASPTVDIGVVSSTGASISPVTASSGGNDTNGAALIRTNGNYGASVVYFAEQDTSSGRLKVAGATCNTTGGASPLDAGSGFQDQCFNSSTTQTSFATAGLEAFGMTVGDILYPTGSITTNLTRDAEYDGDGSSASGFAWDSSGTTDTIATSTTVLDYEMMVLRFAARAAATTPTGSYTVTSTYVGTPSF